MTGDQFLQALLSQDLQESTWLSIDALFLDWMDWMDGWMTCCLRPFQHYFSRILLVCPSSGAGIDSRWRRKSSTADVVSSPKLFSNVQPCTITCTWDAFIK